MPKKDWEEIKTTIDNKSPDLLDNFINSDNIFLPNKQTPNPFSVTEGNFTAQHFNKSKPGSWIPLYSPKTLSNFFLENNISPIRSGKAAFFFYKGNIFFQLTKVPYIEIQVAECEHIESFIPLTLKSNFQRNENAFLNKAVALGIINHFVDGNHYSVFKKEIKNNRTCRLLYGQFGKIKITEPILFLTTKTDKEIMPGFQFEIDLVLENEDEIIIFEAKMGKKHQPSFSLLQLYYPLIYFKNLTGNQKKIRTIFIDITHNQQSEDYRLIEFVFINNQFDNLTINKAIHYK